MATGRIASASVPLYATGAQISLNTASAVADTQIVVRGTGWPGGVPISIGLKHFVQMDGVVNAFDNLAQTTATSAGTFTSPAFLLPLGTCGIPPRAGTTVEIVAHTLTGSIQSTAALSIAQTPTIAVDLPFLQLPRGATSIPVSGSAWVQGTTVSLVAADLLPDCHIVTPMDALQCLTPLVGAQPVVAVAAADGHFRSDVSIPLGVLPGTQVTIRAAVSASPYGDLVFHSEWQAQVLPVVAPTLTADHATGPAGARVVVSGDHWPASQQVVVSYCRREAMSQGTVGLQCNQNAHGTVVTGYAQELGEADIDGSGHFTLQVMLPANARPGAITFEARLTGQPLAADVYVQTTSFLVTGAGSPQAAGLGWPFAAGSVVLAVLSVLAGILLWRRRRLRLHADRSIR
ncbi:MAG TPA: hypothetical protein VKT52_00500 [Ktedonobacterales bacterium]|nr:hypothetical protein [Ktedonobacterales bacterium]